MPQEVERKGWTLYQDTQGNSIFPVPGEGHVDCVFWLCHGDQRVCFQVPISALVQARSA